MNELIEKIKALDFQGEVTLTEVEIENDAWVFMGPEPSNKDGLRNAIHLLTGDVQIMRHLPAPKTRCNLSFAVTTHKDSLPIQKMMEADGWTYLGGEVDLLTDVFDDMIRLGVTLHFLKGEPV